MFTGIIDHCGVIERIEERDQSLGLTLSTQFHDFVLGESIAVDGICLTVTVMGEDWFGCDISKETLSVTTAGQFREGRRVNLERALRMSDRMGGHWVLGHVDQIAQVKRITPVNEYLEMQFSNIDANQLAYLVPKGSVAINGVSLTINQVNTDGFSIMLIPHTLARTNLSDLREQDKVNIEFDYIAKIVAHQYSFKAQQS